MFDQSNVVKVLMMNNPWLSGNKSDIFENYPHARFQLESLMKTLGMKSRRFAIVTGMRRVGKTTLMKQSIQRLLDQGIPANQLFYLPCDHPLLEGAEIPDLIEVIEMHFAPSNKWYLFLDEIHVTNQWNVWLKVIHDQNSAIRIVATGSANPALVQGMNDSGLGRWRETNLPTMSFAEYCQMKNMTPIEMPLFPDKDRRTSSAELWQMAEKTKTLQPWLKKYVQEGGFPERNDAEDLDDMNQVLYNDLFIIMLRRDLIRYLDIRKLDAFTRLFRYMIEQTGQIVNITKIAKEIGEISKDTVNEYLDHFCSFGLLYKAEMLDKGGSKILKTQSKYHISDPALYSIFHQGSVLDTNKAGNLIESLVYKHVADRFGTRGEHLGYFRDKSNRNKEIDVVLKNKECMHFMEVKYQSNAKPKASDALMNMARQYPEEHYYFLTKDNSSVGILRDDNATILSLPVHTFLYWVSAKTKTDYK